MSTGGVGTLSHTGGIGGSTNTGFGGGIGGASGSAGGIGGTLGGIGTGTGGINSGTYIQQRSSNYLSDSRGSGVSGVSGLSRGELSNKSSKTGGGATSSYNYQEMYQKETTVKNSGVDASEITNQQRYIRMEQSSSEHSGSSMQFGSSTKDLMQRSNLRGQHQFE